MRTDTPQTIRLDAYRAPDYRIETVDLDIALDPDRTLVRARLSLHRAAEGPAPLVLDGEGLETLSVALDGKPLPPEAYTIGDDTLTLHAPPARFTLETTVAIAPAANTRLEGLYVSSGNFCTQCEAEGFRHIAWFLDRPDVMATYRVRMEADRARYPVLLSNGNLIGEGQGADGRHWAEWHDPFPKPCYLFALVAGDLALYEDRFATMDGRDVRLCMYVEHGNETRCAYAMDSLKRSMRWDEEAYGRAYDLDRFNIVAVGDFNMGAMENKSLNVFNAKYVLADPATATDADYAFIESIVAHEYFHNWTGNRITCRDWFQLSLKEGLTVFRDQQFSADMRSAPVKRIQDVRSLRARQFPEDAGPLAHPVRPDSYIEINNFYTATVYEKGAEVIRMMHALLGAEGFRRGMDLYFERHDGQAVTCDDFVRAMEDASGVDLTQFRRWYVQAGTPEIEYDGAYDAASQSYMLTVRQRTKPTPGQPDKQPLHMPMALGLIGRSGKPLPVRLAGEPADRAAETRVLDLRAASETFRFIDVPEPPVPSLFRGFSAPAKVVTATPDGERAFLMAHDRDPFNRWESGQQYATALILRMVAELQAGRTPAPDTTFISALSSLLDDAPADRAFAAEALALPSEDFIAGQMPVVDVVGVHAAREALRGAVAAGLRDKLLATYRDGAGNAPYSPDAESAGRRKLRNLALGYLAALDEPAMRDLVVQHYRAADNMTDSVAALAILADIAGPEREAALADFYARWKDDPIVTDKWLSIQAMSALPDTLAQVEALLGHPAFSIRNPNRVRALIGAFCSGNPVRFHAADGSGYRFLADRVLDLDKLNPQVAARLSGALGHWRRYDPERQALMRGELGRIAGAKGLSRDVFEIVSKSLG
ncbi:MAG: aminopeptidase N [Alphaproteobacteria bacterium]